MSNPDQTQRKFLTKAEAYAAMQEGKRISHIYFTPNEYIHIQYNLMYTEDGYSFDDEWQRRTQPEWQSGWFVWENIYGN